MKKLFLIIALLTMVGSSFAQETHFDFAVTNSSGYDIYYRILDSENAWVEATYPCQHDDNYWWGYDKPEGKLILAENVSHNGIDYTVVGVGAHAFSGCSGLRGSLEMPENLNYIGEGAFKGCSNLSGDLIIPSTVVRIENETFSGCSGLSGKITLSDSLTYIGDKAFYNCSSVTGTLKVPDKVTHIGDNAFEQCTFRGMLVLPAALQHIGNEAFKGMTQINSISIKATVPPTTGSNAFSEVHTWISVSVPYTSKEAYKNTPEWSRFANNIVEKSHWSGKAEPWTKGSGTAADPYLIESAENLAWLAKSVNERIDIQITTAYSPGGAEYYIYHFYDVNAYQDTCFRLVIDIDLWNPNYLFWKPIGNTHAIIEEDYPGSIDGPHYYLDVFNNRHYYFYASFCGNFDGNEHTISNYKMYDDYWRDDSHVVYYYRGLFGIVKDGSLDNINILNISINSQKTSKIIGGLVGTATNTTISNCHTSGLLKTGNVDDEIDVGLNIVGGVVGTAQSCRIDGCSSSCELSVFSSNSKGAGGIVGAYIIDTQKNDNDGLFNCCYIGHLDTRSVTESSYNYLAIGGGIVGSCLSTTEGEGTMRFENCYSRGLIEGAGYSWGSYHAISIGGILGYTDAIDTLKIMNCYTNDTIKGNSTCPESFGGGIVGKSSSNTVINIRNCYHVGPITTYNKSGIIAQNTDMTIVRNCYYERSSASVDGYGIPLESDYMKTEAFVSQINNGSSSFMMDHEPYQNGGYPVFGTDGLIFVGAEWYYEIQNIDGTITYQHLECTGDTVIENKRPKIIVRSNTHYDHKESTEVTREYVYEENGIVYWWNEELQEFTTLYDFGAEVGEEWEIKVGSESIVTRVYEIDNQMIDGIPYKRMTIGDADGIFSGTLISTIGHLTSFFPEKLMNRGKGYRVEGLRCYWMDGDLILKIGERDCDEVYKQLHYGTDENTAQGFAVYPNPANGVLFVETFHGTSLQGNAEYRITNLMGQTLLQGSIGSENQQIDINTLPAGMYFLTVEDETLKFVKQ